MSESTESPAVPSTTSNPPFDPGAMTRAASDAMSVRRVFGEAYEHNGVWVVPVAKLIGGTGNGFGVGVASGSGVPGRAKANGVKADGAHDDAAKADGAAAPGLHGESEGSGGGGGFGALVRPLGVYVVDDAGVHWRPALDINRAILGGQVVAIVLAFALTRVLRRRRR